MTTDDPSTEHDHLDQVDTTDSPLLSPDRSDDLSVTSPVLSPDSEDGGKHRNVASDRAEIDIVPSSNADHSDLKRVVSKDWRFSGQEFVSRDGRQIFLPRAKFGCVLFR